MFLNVLSQQFFSHVGTEPALRWYYQYFQGVKCLAQGHNTVARWPSGRASDSRARGRGFDPHSGGRVVSLSAKYIFLLKSTGNTQEAAVPSHD